MKPIKETIKVEISNLKVEDGFYSFDYKVWRNGKLIADDNEENDYDIPKRAIEESLNKNGYAVEIATIRALG